MARGGTQGAKSLKELDTLRSDGGHMRVQGVSPDIPGPSASPTLCNTLRENENPPMSHTDGFLENAAFEELRLKSLLKHVHRCPSQFLTWSKGVATGLSSVAPCLAYTCMHRSEACHRTTLLLELRLKTSGNRALVAP